MPKELKYKKGFTWRHHLDEKWDRLDYSFKLKIQAFFFIFIIAVSVLGLVWANQKEEKAQLIKDGASRSEATPKQTLQGASRIISPPLLHHAED